jgi:predicted glycoside hydrolase/deacetylase ChbG (UPF0249 family)
MAKYLIVNADDFGLSSGVNRGIIECAERGVLTSASLMVRWPTAAEAAGYVNQLEASSAKSENPWGRRISLGLHIDLGEWVLRDADWVPLYSVVDTRNAPAVRAEIYRQLSEFRRLVGRNPTHLDSHQHVHRREPAYSIMLQLATELRIPLRECDSRIRYCGDFYGQGAEGEPWPELISSANLKQIIQSLPEGTTELGCHPGYGETLQSPYRSERAREVATLCDPTVLSRLTELDIHLRSFDSFVLD